MYSVRLRPFFPDLETVALQPRRSAPAPGARRILPRMHAPLGRRSYRRASRMPESSHQATGRLNPTPGRDPTGRQAGAGRDDRTSEAPFPGQVSRSGHRGQDVNVNSVSAGDHSSSSREISALRAPVPAVRRGKTGSQITTRVATSARRTSRY